MVKVRVYIIQGDSSRDIDDEEKEWWENRERERREDEQVEDDMACNWDEYWSTHNW